MYICKPIRKTIVNEESNESVLMTGVSFICWDDINNNARVTSDEVTGETHLANCITDDHKTVIFTVTDVLF